MTKTEHLEHFKGARELAARLSDQIEMCERQKLKNTDFKELESWEDFLIVTQEVRPHDTVIIISARKSTLSYHPLFDKVPYYISKYFTANNFMIIFPQQKERTLHEGEVFNPLKIN